MQTRLGTRIQKLREQREISREDLAANTGLGIKFIAALEEEDLYPSLGPLLKIARALGVRLGTFLDDVESEDPCIVRKAERKPDLAMHSRGGYHESLRFHSLGRGKADRHMEPFYIELSPEEDEPELSAHQGEEFIVVVSGKVELKHGQNSHVLTQGDSMYFNSIVPHWVGCAGDEPAEIYAVLYFPE